jgi:hypothetical protein
MSERAYNFLTATLGHEGSVALRKACERVHDLGTVMFPRAVLAWLSFVAPHGYQGPIPGTDGFLRFSKSEDSEQGTGKEQYAGEVTWNGQTYTYTDASLYQIAAAVALAIGAKAKEVSAKLKPEELASLGKSVDVLVKAHAANEQLRKADLPGATARPKGQQGPAAPGAPVPPKVGGATAPRLPSPVGPAAPATPTPGAAGAKVPKLPGVGKKNPAPKLPALKVGKSELSNLCSMCGRGQFTGKKFTGCVCLRALAKSVTSTEKPDGVLLTFGNAWDREDIESLMNLLRGDE